MRSLSMLCLVALAALSSQAQAETKVYPPSFAQSAALTLEMPAGITSVVPPDSVRTAYANAVNKRVWRTSLGAWSDDHLVVDATASDAYDNIGAPRSLITRKLTDAQGEQQSWFASVRAAAWRSPLTQVELLVGQDVNGDGLPQANEELCRAGQDLADAQYCLLDLRGKTNLPLWAFAHVIGGDDAVIEVHIATADFQLRESGTKISIWPSYDIRVSPGSGTAPSTLDFSYQLDPQFDQAAPYQDVGGLLLTGADDALAGATVWPVRLDVTPFVQTDKTYALAAREGEFEEIKLELKPGETLDRLYLDNPGLEYMELVMTGNASVTGWLEPLPASSTDSRPTFIDPPPVPPAFYLGPATPPSAVNALRGTRLPHTGARIRLAVRNMDLSSPVTARLRVMLGGLAFGGEWHGLEYSSTGNYFNPLRSGEGVFFDRVGIVQVFYWYTFEKNGNPIWYTAAVSMQQGARGSTDTALYRVEADWFGQTTAKPVGRIVLTQVDDRTLIFSWTIDGDSGSNRIVLATEPRCTQTQSLDNNLTGHWFDLQNPGLGTNLLGLRHGAAEGLYFFDAEGAPRWVFGLLDDQLVALGGPLYQFKGACPACTYFAPTVTPVGNARLVFSNSTDAKGSFEVHLAPPLRGGVAWHPTLHRATDAATCSTQE